jgi:hypothetical protein
MVPWSGKILGFAGPMDPEGLRRGPRLSSKGGGAPLK